MHRRILLAISLCSLQLLLHARVAAQCADEACAHFGANNTTIDVNTTTLLNKLDSALTGATINLSTPQLGALNSAKVSVKDLQAAVQVNGLANSDASALTANLSLSQAYQVLATALTAVGNTAAASAAVTLSNQTTSVVGSVSLGSLITSDTRPVVNTSTSLNALELVDGLASQFNANNVNTVQKVTLDPSGLTGVTGLGTVELSILVLQPAKFVCGTAGATFYSSSLRVKLHANLTAAPVTLSVAGLTNISLTLTSLDLMLQLGRATGTLQSIAALASAVTLQATPGVSEIYLGTVSDAAFLRRGLPAIDRSANSTEFAPATIAGLSVRLLGIPINGNIGVRSYVSTGTGTATTLMYNGPYPQSRTAQIGTSPLGTALGTLLADMTINVDILGLGNLLNGLISAITTNLRSVTGALGTTLSTLLGNVVDPLLSQLGVRFGAVDAIVDKAYVVPTGASCDDSQYCTVNDTCTGTTCAGTARDCSDSLSCTTDSCNEATDSCVSTVSTGCLINGACQAAGAPDPANQCRACIPAQSTSAYANLAGTSCSDGQFCTTGEQCNLGVCAGGTALNCSDGLSCTTDTCNETTDSCVSTPLLSCVINGACYAAGAVDPSNACRSCNPLVSTTAFSNSTAGTGCDDGRYCTLADVCNGAGVCGGTQRPCADLLACTTDTCSDTLASCVFTPNAGCVINGLCVAAGTNDPTNACRSCNPAVSATAWSNKASGVTCDDGQYCTTSDVCNGAGACAGSARDCSDGNACTTDTCSELLDTCSSTVTTGCLIDGACRATNTDDPQNPCHTCNPTLIRTAWTNKTVGTTCDDNLYCTVSDTCSLLGTCTGNTRNCSDGVLCTVDSCNETTDSCSSAPPVAGCVINGACYADGAAEFGNPCHTCNAAVSTTGWTNRPTGTTCDDGQFCTSGDTCGSNGSCAGSARDCSDGNACTADSCNELLDLCSSSVSSGCLIDGACRAADSVDPSNPCHVCNPTLSTALWTNKTPGTSCDDGQFCTQSDACSLLGTCTGLPRDCSDGVLCTIDTCNESTDACSSSTLITGGCVIGNACYADGSDDPSNGCRSCNASVSTSSWTNKAMGTTCNDGDACTVADVCGSGGTCAGAARDCSDGNACTTDTCNVLFGTCSSTVSSGCLIDGACRAADSEDPSNACHVCNPALSTLTWTNKTVGTGCNDGQFCTTGDACSLLGTCTGLPRDCSDGVLCTIDTCNEDTDLCSSAGLVAGCVIDGACYANGTSDPSNGCRSCNTAVSTTAWTNKAAGATCTDNQLCTVSDSCNGAGVCAGTARTCADDGLSCTTASCNTSTGLCTQTTSSGCLILGACYAAGDPNPGNPCQACDPTQSTFLWSNRATGSSCDDGQFCTMGDTCNALGLCTGNARDCSDGQNCTLDLCDELSDQCTSTTLGCIISGVCQLLGAQDPQNACRVCNPSLSGSTWSPRAAGESCDDGAFCTVDDKCDAVGGCVGTARVCDDGLACSADSCDENANACTGSFAGGCVINNSCVAAGAVNPSNPCQECNPTRSTAAWSTRAAGASCEDGLYCTVGETCNALGLCLGGTPKSCDDGLGCTTDLCNELTRQCTAATTSGCQINGACVAAGTDDPSNACRACNPLLSTTSYSNKLVGSTCDDGQFCTTTDVCNGLGTCGGLPRVCSDGLLCTTDTCNEALDSCTSSPSTGCVIDGACRLAGEEDPQNSCRTCNTAVSRSAWTNKASGTSCNDGQFCTVNDACSAAGSCTGSARVCDDGLACTTESCNETLDLCTPTATTGCLILGACVTAGAEDPQNSCHICDPASSALTWTNRSVGTGCDDGQFCTSGDTCNLLGLCTGNARNCSDGQDCTLDICNELTNECVSTTAGCVIDGACQFAGADDPTNPCRSCNPLVSGSAWTPKAAGSLCNDGQFCTVIDACNAAGSCTGTPRTCSDGLDCSSDTCDENNDVCSSSFGGGCVIGLSCLAAGATNPLNPCQACDPTRSSTSWSPRATGTSCEDGLYCTQGETCNAVGLCLGGSPRVCDDGLACTADTCNELTRQCTAVSTSGCQINGACVSSGSVDPSNSCRACNPLLSTTSYSNKLLGSSCDDGQFCTTTDVCNGAGSCAGTARSCSDGLACTVDACNETTDSCSSSAPSGCVIGGACVAAGGVDPSNACHICDPSVSSSAWTNKAAGSSCDDGQYCTVSDACSAAGSCTGTARACDDGLACTTDTCNEVLDLCTPNVLSGCLILGACVASGTPDPLNSCHVCDPAQSRLAWSNKAVGTGCDDSLFCTTGDTCNALGLCAGVGRDCSDGQDCTADVCNELTDQCVSTTAGCVIAGQCRLAGAEDPQNSCRVCNPLVSSSAWTPKPTGALCNDGQFCTVGDQCNAAGSCQSTGPRVCNDLLTCTTDSCDENADACVGSFAGGCVIAGSCISGGTVNPLNPCQTCDPARSAVTWSARPSGASCEDGLYCTLGESCDALGLCTGGRARACDDGLGCTTDTCSEITRQCVSTVSSGCDINGVCVASGTADPANPCRGCEPLLSTTAFSNKPLGSSCDDGQFCTVTDVCNGSGACTGAPRLCTDGLPCTIDTCNEATDSCGSSAPVGCVIDGACFAAGSEDPNNGCHVCNPAVSLLTWTNKASGSACDDGRYCTVADACSAAGSCTGSARSCDDDGLDCTSELCNEEQDACTPGVLSGCLIAGACVTSGALDPQNACHVCNPAASRTAWSNRDAGTSCDDGQFCTVSDQCSAAGACAGAARDCSDGQDCTADSCDEQADRCASVTAGCIIGGACQLAGSADPQNSCRICDPARSTTSYSPKQSGEACDDGQFCTTEDRCSAAGSCTGSPNPCNDGLDCTADGCDETNDTCTVDYPGGCVIGNQCLAAGAIDPANGCHLCDPSRSTTRWSDQTSGTSCDDGLFCTVSDSCNDSGVCRGSARACDDGLDCTTEACDESTRQCTAAVSSGCNIDGLCVAAGASDPGNACRSCDPSLSTASWSNSAVGVGCDDGEFCTVEDSCDGAGGCAGAARACDDGLDCTVDTCNEASDSCSSGGVTGCVIDGRCVATGSDDPSDSCHTCNPTLTASGWTNKASGVSCDDGQFCTLNDRCDAAGSCSGSARECDDGLGCTTESCDESSDSCEPTVLAGCLIAGACVAAGEPDPSSPCRTCNPSVSSSTWTPKPAGTSCDDGRFCTAGDQCAADGTCGGSARDCSDGQDCTADSCDESSGACLSITSGCVIDGTCYPGGSADPANPCRSCDPARSTSAWSDKTAGDSCDDGLFCTTGDSCDAAGSCQGQARACSDGLDCTLDACDEAGRQCLSTTNAGCVIDGVCRAADSEDPQNGCHVCDPTRATDRWSDKAEGVTCDDHAFCTLDDRCNATGQCTGAPRSCDDGLDCTTDMCDENNDQCSVDATSGCEIAGTCYAPGTVDPSDSCRSCDPLLATTNWSDKQVDSTCDDGVFCTGLDRCTQNHVCVGTARSCDDGLACTLDMCDEAARACRSEPSLDGCVIDGTCQLAGTQNPAQSCQVCDPSLSASAWSNKPAGDSCDDGLYCTDADSCDDTGRCSGSALVCPTGTDCTTEVCDETTRSCVATTVAGCTIDGVCYGADAVDPENPCRSCQPEVSSSAWTNKPSGAACDDGLFCSVGETCDDRGVCGAGAARSCTDAIACTLDMCDEANRRCVSTVQNACLISGVCVPAGTEDPSNTCRSCQPQASATGFSNKPTTASCDDGLFCTRGDHCNAAGACQGGSVTTCDDGLECTADACDENGDACTHQVQQGCVIDATCVALGDKYRLDICLTCQPGNNTAWTRSNDATCLNIPPDQDPDRDGIPNSEECPGSTDCPDTDEDGTPDYLDEDDDQDGLSTRYETRGHVLRDTDRDGRPDYLDPDDDHDGILTKAEAADPNGEHNGDDARDTDRDGVPDYLDEDDDGDTLWTSQEASDPNRDGLPEDARDSDGDGRPDYLDPDDDGDTVRTSDEAPDPNDNHQPEDARDSDGDDRDDYLDTDDDDDGISTRDEHLDSFRFGADIDHDGVPNWLDTDSDGDGLSDKDEGRDYTPGGPVPDYLHSRYNTTPDAGPLPDGGPDVPTAGEPATPGGNGGSGTAGAPVVDPRFDPSRGGVAGGGLCAVEYVGAHDTGWLWWCAGLALGYMRWRRRQR